MGRGGIDGAGRLNFAEKFFGIFVVEFRLRTGYSCEIVVRSGGRLSIDAAGAEHNPWWANSKRGKDYE